MTRPAGHIGTNLVDALRAAGCELTAIDHCDPPPWARSDARWVRADVLARESMRRQLDGVQVVYHLAAHITLDQHNDRGCRSTNDGVENVAGAARGRRTPVRALQPAADTVASLLEFLADSGQTRSRESRGASRPVRVEPPGVTRP